MTRSAAATALQQARALDDLARATTDAERTAVIERVRRSNPELATTLEAELKADAGRTAESSKSESDTPAAGTQGE